ncbi:hypothetical protein FIBSPDRAFT_552484 [Athelia psychrophila]|uniref:Uncharacterized protein n=1 Tax=Athelia psychrophila TaxID=1759441 RepID=A0A166UX46_9AGAM|nr:hypothetical protein FIBSPDRAFT_552484 [Fibularhizoctonia sp. CBS 109695]
MYYKTLASKEDKNKQTNPTRNPTQIRTHAHKTAQDANAQKPREARVTCSAWRRRALDSPTEGKKGSSRTLFCTRQPQADLSHRHWGLTKRRPLPDHPPHADAPTRTHSARAHRPAAPANTPAPAPELVPLLLGHSAHTRRERRAEPEPEPLRQPRHLRELARPRGGHGRGRRAGHGDDVREQRALRARHAHDPPPRVAREGDELAQRALFRVEHRVHLRVYMVVW